MKVVDITNSDLDFIKEFTRNYVPATQGAEMICAALTHDENVEVKAVLDERGIAAAVSYTTYRDRLHVFSLGSIVKGAGSLLMDSVELLARALSLPVTVGSMVSSEGFYAQRGYRRTRGQKASSVIRMRKKP
jgi:hypothetical protein